MDIPASFSDRRVIDDFDIRVLTETNFGSIQEKIVIAQVLSASHSGIGDVFGMGWGVSFFTYLNPRLKISNFILKLI